MLRRQVLAYVCEELMAGGALDAWVTPAVMKKGRPGWVLGTLCRPGEERRLMRVVLSETTSLGVRVAECSRAALHRDFRPATTPWVWPPPPPQLL